MNSNNIVRKITDPEVMRQIKESNKRKGAYAKKFRMDMIDLRTKLTLAEIKRQLYELQQNEVAPIFQMPFHNNMPATFLALHIKCTDDYACSKCNKRFHCFQKSIERLTSRANQKDYYKGINIPRESISEYALLHGKTPSHIDEYNSAIIDSLKEIYLSLGE